MTTMDEAGAAVGYRPRATLSLGTEVRRQASRRRTQMALGFMVLLPWILVGAFKLAPRGNDSSGGGGNGNGNGGFGLVDLATGGGLNFAMFTLMMSAGFLLVVVVALFCGDTVASEASWGSLRYLLAVPVPRARLLAVKLVVALFYSALAIVLVVTSALAAGTLVFGWHPLRAPVGGEMTAGEGLWRLGAVSGYLAVSLLVVASLAFMLSVSTDAPLGAVGGAVLLQIISVILDQVTALGDLRNVLPTHYTTAWLGLLSSPIQTDDMVKGAIAAISYATLFFSIAWWRFLRKDVVS